MKGKKDRLKILSISEITVFKKIFKVDTVGGIETNHKNLMAGMKRRGHVVLENRDYPPGTVPDIIICPTYGPIAMVKIWLKKKKYKCACVQHAHTTQEDMKGGFLPGALLPYVKIYLQQLYKFSEVLITPSNFSKQTLLMLGLPTRPPIVPVSNGIDLTRFAFSQQRRDAFRSMLSTKFKLDVKKPVVLGVGVIWERKGIDVFHFMARKMPGCEFVWVGNIVTAKKLVAQYNNLPNLTFTGFVDDIVAAYCGADVFFFPSRAENQGIPLLEAAACRLPILCRDLPTYDWLSNGVDCIKETTLDGFESSLRRLLQDQGLKEELVARAFENVKAHDIEAIVSTVEGLYRRAIRLRQWIVSKHA